MSDLSDAMEQGLKLTCCAYFFYAVAIAVFFAICIVVTVLVFDLHPSISINLK